MVRASTTEAEALESALENPEVLRELTYEPCLC